MLSIDGGEKRANQFRNPIAAIRTFGVVAIAALAML